MRVLVWLALRVGLLCRSCCPEPHARHRRCDLPLWHGGRHGHSGLDGHKWRALT